jgi:signal transduction histidine kinase
MDTVTPSRIAIKSKKGLTKKLVLSMLLVGTLPLLIGLLLAFYQGTQSIQEVNGTSFQALATETARKLDFVVSDELAQTRLLTLNPDLIQLLEKRRDDISEVSQTDLTQLLEQEQKAWIDRNPDLVKRITQGPIAQQLRQLIGGSYVDPSQPIPLVTRTATRGLHITDIAGRLVASADTNPSYLHAQEEWWKGAFHKGIGQPYIGSVAFNQGLDTYTFTLALPIMDSLQYKTIGVLRRIYDAKEFFSPSTDIIRFGKTGHVMLIDSRGVVLTCPILPTGTVLSDNQLIHLVTPMKAGWTAAPTDGHGGQETSIIGYAPLPNVSSIIQDSTGLAWHMFVWQSSEELFGPIQSFFKWIAGFGLLGVGLLVTLGYLAAYRIASPIRRLQEATRQIGHGEFHEPITINTGDEIEELADEINRMKDQIESTVTGLESQVETKAQEVKYLQESTSKILDGVPDPVVMIDDQEQIEYLNQATKEILDLNNGEVIGVPLFQLLQVDPTTQKRLHAEIQNVQAKLLDTSSLPSEIPTSIRDPLVATQIEDSDSDRQELRLNNRTYRYRWFAVQTAPDKKPCAGLVLRDMTEESLLQDKLIQGEKMASLGVLSAGIGHELNNPLVGVIGLGEAIQEEAESEEIKEYAKGIVQHGKRMASVVRDFTGQMNTQFLDTQTRVNINEQLEKVLSATTSLFTSSQITVNTQFEPLPPVQAQPNELGQAFTNIINNSLQAMEEGGTLEVTTRIKDHIIHILIKDSGTGIAPSHLSKVFDPFFTTKTQGEGAGLGLTIAHRLITKMGGQIRLESEKNQGTTCHITFPLPTPQPATRKE